MPWNTGTACALTTTPHKSRPPCHGKRERLSQLLLEKMTGFGKATVPKNGNKCREYRPRLNTLSHTRGM